MPIIKTIFSTNYGRYLISCCWKSKQIFRHYGTGQNTEGY